MVRYGILIDPVKWIQVFVADPYSWPSFSLIVCECITSPIISWIIFFLTLSDVLVIHNFKEMRHVIFYGFCNNNQCVVLLLLVVRKLVLLNHIIRVLHDWWRVFQFLTISLDTRTVSLARVNYLTWANTLLYVASCPVVSLSKHVVGITKDPVCLLVCYLMNIVKCVATAIQTLGTTLQSLPCGTIVHYYTTTLHKNCPPDWRARPTVHAVNFLCLFSAPIP